MALTCHPAWLRPYESLWSLVCKLAFVHEMTLGQLWGVLRHALEPIQIWTWGCGRSAEHLQSRLAVAFEHLPSTTLARYVAAPGDYCDVRRPVHYCPECLRDFYHSALFQHRAVTSCPVHRRPLAAGCQACGAQVCYFEGAPWRCAVCARPLVESDPERFERYRSPTPSEPFDELAQQLESAAHERRAARAQQERAGVVALDQAPATVDHLYWETRTGSQHLAREYFNALSAFTLANFDEQLRCAHPSDSLPRNAVRYRWGGLDYSCRAGLAITLAAERLWLRPEVLGGWPADWHANQRAGTVLARQLSRPPSIHLGPQAAETVIGILARQVYAECLEAELPTGIERPSSWDCPVMPQVQWDLAGGQLRFASRVTQDDLARLVARAQLACPNIHRPAANRPTGAEL